MDPEPPESQLANQIDLGEIPHPACHRFELDFHWRLIRSATLTAAGLLFATGALAQNPPAKLDVDTTDAPRKISHARLGISPSELQSAGPELR